MGHQLGYITRQSPCFVWACVHARATYLEMLLCHLFVRLLLVPFLPGAIKVTFCHSSIDATVALAIHSGLECELVTAEASMLLPHTLYIEQAFLHEHFWNFGHLSGTNWLAPDQCQCLC